MRALHHSPRSSVLPPLDVAHVWTRFLFLSVFLLFSSQPFCLWGFPSCLEASLFLFSSQNLFWDSVLVHPSIQLTTVDTRRCWGLGFRSAHLARLVGWYLLQEIRLFRAWTALSLPARGPHLQKTRIRKGGALKIKIKKERVILAFSVPMGGFLCFDESRVRTQIVKWMAVEGSHEKEDFASLSLLLLPVPAPESPTPARVLSLSVPKGAIPSSCFNLHPESP